MSQTQTSVTAPLPFPDHRDIYLLIVGVLLGIIMGPAVLGSALPDVYEGLFSAGEDLHAMRQQHNEQTQQQIEALEITGVTQPAVQELLVQREMTWQGQLDVIDALRDRRAGGLIWALLAAIVVVMLLETLLSPQPNKDDQSSEVHPAYRRLMSMRYALIALSIAIMLARPSLLQQIPLLTTALILIVALIVGLIPLGPKLRD